MFRSSINTHHGDDKMTEQQITNRIFETDYPTDEEIVDHYIPEDVEDRYIGGVTGLLPYGEINMAVHKGLLMIQFDRPATKVVFDLISDAASREPFDPVSRVLWAAMRGFSDRLAEDAFLGRQYSETKGQTEETASSDQGPN